MGYTGRIRKTPNTNRNYGSHGMTSIFLRPPQWRQAVPLAQISAYPPNKRVDLSESCQVHWREKSFEILWAKGCCLEITFKKEWWQRVQLAVKRLVKALHILRGNLSQDIQVISYRVGVYRIQINPKGYPQIYWSLWSSKWLLNTNIYSIYIYINHQMPAKSPPLQNRF